MLGRVTLLTTSVVAVTLAGCGSDYQRFYLDPTSVERSTATAVCFQQEGLIGAFDLPLDRDHILRPAPEAPGKQPPTVGSVPFLFGPESEPTTGPAYGALFITGGVSIGVGLGAAALGAFGSFGCAESEDCNQGIPGGIAIAGLGLAVVGAVLMGVGASDDRVTDRAAASLCTPQAPEAPR